LVRELKGRDYPVRLLSEREGQGALYRVRVGGYKTEPAAEAAGRELQSRGYSTWVVSGD
jgi:cell division protein FtsN